jgi:predicted DNA-binding protein
MYNIYIMRRTQIYLEELQDERLTRRAAAQGVTKSTLIREAIEEYLASGEEESLRVDRLHAALKEAAGIAPYLPDGASYVEEMRRADVRRQQELEARRRE